VSERRGKDTRERLLVTAADLAQPALDLLQDFDVVYAGKAPTEESLVQLCRQHNPVAVIVRYVGASAAMMDAAPALRVISKHGSGTDNIDKAAAAQRDIEVRAAVGANAAAVAEHAIALMLACAKSVVALNTRMHAGHWDKATHKSLELAGRTVGLVGLGAIGQRVARICLAMDMRVVAYDPFAARVPEGVERLSLEDLWARADVLSLHCPLTESNHQLINAQTLALCRPGVILVNTARGGLVDEAALLAAVNRGHVAVAGLDSFDKEPMPVPHAFQGHPAFVLSPHIGGVTSDAYVNMGVAAARNVLAVLNSMTETTP
jgi:D-3-phosphoglycerate dehydrogenase / 2-oxoglutarate reductase